MRSYSLSAGQAGAITAPMHLYGGIAASLLTAWLLAQPWMANPRRIVWLLGSVIGVSTVISIVIYWSALAAAVDGAVLGVHSVDLFLYRAGLRVAE